MRVPPVWALLAVCIPRSGGRVSPCFPRSSSSLGYSWIPLEMPQARLLSIQDLLRRNFDHQIKIRQQSEEPPVCRTLGEYAVLIHRVRPSTAQMKTEVTKWKGNLFYLLLSNLLILFCCNASLPFLSHSNNTHRPDPKQTPIPSSYPLPLCLCFLWGSDTLRAVSKWVWRRVTGNPHITASAAVQDYCQQRENGGGKRFHPSPFACFCPQQKLENDLTASGSSNLATLSFINQSKWPNQCFYAFITVGFFMQGAKQGIYPLPQWQLLSGCGRALVGSQSPYTPHPALEILSCEWNLNWSDTWSWSGSGLGAAVGLGHSVAWNWLQFPDTWSATVTFSCFRHWYWRLFREDTVQIRVGRKSSKRE